MSLECAAACQTCDQLLSKHEKCSSDGIPMAWNKTGDLDAMFRRIVDNPYYQQYGPITVHSSPATEHGGGPWVITLDNFLTEEECCRLIELGQQEGYHRSMEAGLEALDGSFADIVNDRRTSLTAWCPDGCNEDPVVKPVLERMENLTGVPNGHSEWFQMLFYEPGQYYSNHHDYIMAEVEKPQGPRIFTLFLYLNDVPEGGATRFETLDLTVLPKRGRALLWPNVCNDSPMLMDPRTNHEALPVIEGVKYGANAWFHLRDYKQRFEDCSR